MEILRLEFALKPRAKARPRVTRRGTYMPPGYVAWKRKFAGYARSQIPPEWGMPTGRVYCDVYIICKRKCLPDADNALGSIYDALQGVAYVNDKQIRSGEFDIAEDTGHPDRIVVTLRKTGF